MPTLLEETLQADEERSIAGYSGSPWLVREALPRPPLLADIETDAIVVGAGIVGVLVARELTSRGFEVAVLERAKLGRATTGNSTAKVTVLHGTDWSRITKHHPVDDALREWALLNTAAPSVLGRIAREDEVLCRMRTLDARLCVREDSDTGSLERQHQALKALGVPVRDVDRMPSSPLGPVTAFGLPHQAQFDPYAFTSGVMDALCRGGCLLFENTAVRSIVPDAKGWVAITDGGTVRAPVVVMASLAPARDPALLFARLFPYAHYAIECIPGDRTDGMWIEAGGGYLTARPVDGAEGRWIFSGESGRIASDPDATVPMQRLIGEVMGATESGEPYRYWMAEDYSTPDGLPFAGRVGARDGLYYVGGFGGWGITKSQVCAALVADQIEGLDRAGLTELLAPNRFPARTTQHYLLSENVFTAKHLLFPTPAQRHALEPVEAIGLAEGGTPPRCTHMGCRTQVNSIDLTLDCPCHGSRFAEDGEPLYGPARKSMRMTHQERQHVGLERGRARRARLRAPVASDPVRLAAVWAFGIAAALATLWAITRGSKAAVRAAGSAAGSAAGKMRRSCC